MAADVGLAAGTHVAQPLRDIHPLALVTFEIGVSLLVVMVFLAVT